VATAIVTTTADDFLKPALPEGAGDEPACGRAFHKLAGKCSYDIINVFYKP
jgi:hypothetical protein